jgi:hypothetical protein
MASDPADETPGNSGKLMRAFARITTLVRAPRPLSLCAPGGYVSTGPGSAGDTRCPTVGLGASRECGGCGHRAPGPERIARAGPPSSGPARSTRQKGGHGLPGSGPTGRANTTGRRAVWCCNSGRVRSASGSGKNIFSGSLSGLFRQSWAWRPAGPGIATRISVNPQRRTGQNNGQNPDRRCRRSGPGPGRLGRRAVIHRCV